MHKDTRETIETCEKHVEAMKLWISELQKMYGTDMTKEIILRATLEL